MSDSKKRNQSDITTSDITTAATAAMKMIDKLNNDRFKKLNQINNLFMLTTFYHVGGNPADSCKADKRNEFKVIDPRFVCEVSQTSNNIGSINADAGSINSDAGSINADPNYRYFLNFVLQYKLWQRIPVYDPNSKDTITGSKCNFYPESFNSILQWLIASTDFSNLEIKFRADSYKEQWANMLASLYYFDKLRSFKEYAMDVYEFTENRINYLCALPSETSEVVYDRQTFESAIKRLTQLAGMSRSKAISNHIGMFIVEASYCTESLKNEYKSIKNEYDKAVEDIKQILKDSKELTLCWNSANISPSYIGSEVATNGGSNVNYQNIEQVLNCAQEQLATKVNDMSDNELMSFMRDNRQLINETNTLAIANQKLIEETIEKSKKIIIGTIVAIIILFMILIYLFIKLRSYEHSINQNQQNINQNTTDL